MPMVSVNSAYIIFTDLRSDKPLYWEVEGESSGSTNLIISKRVGNTQNPCSLYYSIGKRDDTGFTPETMEWDSTSQTLSVIGKQTGTSGDVRRLYRRGSISPRYATLFNDSTLTNYARMRIGDIIVDVEVEQPNIIGYFEGLQPIELTTTVSSQIVEGIEDEEED